MLEFQGKIQGLAGEAEDIADIGSAREGLADREYKTLREETCAAMLHEVEVGQNSGA